MMSKEDRRILNEFAACVHERLPDARIWAFGSRARGDATWDSDFDVFIVLDEVDQGSDRWIREIAWEVGFENDRVITTVLLDKEQFEHGPMSESTLVVNSKSIAIFSLRITALLTADLLIFILPATSAAFIPSLGL